MIRKLKRFYAAGGPFGSDVGGGGGPEITLEMTSSAPLAGEGTLDFTGGEDSEVITLLFTITDYPEEPLVSFSAPVSVGSLESLHLTRTGTVTLDGSGNATSDYTITDNTRCTVQITARSSGLGIPVSDTTIISTLL